MPTTATTERQLSPVVRATQAVLTSPTVLRKSAVGLATQAIQNPEALVQKYLATYVVQNVVLRRKIPMVISA